MIHQILTNTSAHLFTSRYECLTFTSQFIWRSCLIFWTRLLPLALLSFPLLIIFTTSKESTFNSTAVNPICFAHRRPSKNPHSSATKALHFSKNLENSTNHSPSEPLISPPHPAILPSLQAPSISILTHPNWWFLPSHLLQMSWLMSR